MTSLRHTYLTAIEFYRPNNITKLIQHYNPSITKKHYVDQKEAAKSITIDRSKTRFRVFPKRVKLHHKTTPQIKKPPQSKCNGLNFRVERMGVEPMTFRLPV